MEERQTKFRDMRICRFCLTEKDPLSNIYEKDNKNAIPLPLQIMACVTIEVFTNDGMPQLICDDCRLQTRRSYAFKSMCKKSDDALKLFLATGVLKRHEKDEILKPKINPKRSSDTETQTAAQKRPKISNPAENIKQEVLSEEASDSPCPLALITVEQGEVPLPETPKNPTKQVATHCFSCDYCERSFPLEQLLQIHMRQHTRERKFNCFECGKKFFSKHDLTKHTQTHSGEKPFTCVACNKSFARASLLHRHEKVHVSVPKFLCDVCDKTYLTAEDLDAHYEVHKRKRPFKCLECNKSFAFKQGLERHTMLHGAENPYKCDYCEETFASPQKLARHVTSHAGERPYPCKLCPRTFLLSHHLSRHLRSHYNRKAMGNEFGIFKCDICSMSFRRKDSLINHTAIHSMVNLKCVICNKEFGDAKTVKEHVSTHLASLPFPCDRCDYSFETQEELEDHEVKHTDEEDEESNAYILQNETLEIVQTFGENNQDPLEEDEVRPVRRSLRESKIKNYADFLKDELGSDTEEESDESEEIIPEPPKIQIGTIQPVVRGDGIKMYKGKDKPEKNIILNFEQKFTPPNTEPEIQQNEQKTNESRFEINNLVEIEPGQINAKTPKSVTKITTLENLGISKQTLDAMTEKSGFVEMKLGQKVIRVQKLMMTKAEYQQMSKKGNFEMKGSTVVVPNIEEHFDVKKLTQLSKTVAHDQIGETKVNIDANVDVQVSKNPVKTYVKKHISTPKKENCVTEIIAPKNASEINIDLTEAEAESDTIEKTELFTSFQIIHPLLA